MTLTDLDILIKANDVPKLKTALEETVTDRKVADLLKMYNITGHKVMNSTDRPDKKITDENGNLTETVKVSRIPLALQQKIVRQAAVFLGTPILKSTPEGSVQDNMMKILDKILDDNKFEYKFRTCVKACKSEKQSAIVLYAQELDPATEAEYWEGYEFDSKFKIRMRVLAESLNDVLYPIFDNMGDMIAFGRYYTYKETVEGKQVDIERLELYTSKQIIFYLKSGAEDWVEESKSANIYGKIPVIYFSQPAADFEDVQALIERLETKMSNHADTNDYYDSPIVKAKGKVQGFSKKGESGKVLEMSADADVSYLTYDSLPASMELEMTNLVKFINILSNTADTSFEEMKGLGHFSIIALKMFFMDPHMKANDSEEIFGEGAQRLINYLKSTIAVIDSKYKEALKLQVRPEFRYFLPRNEQEEIGNVVSAYGAGLLSLETAVSLNPLVEDAVKELERINAEKEAAAARIAATKPKEGESSEDNPGSNGGGGRQPG